MEESRIVEIKVNGRYQETCSTKRKSEIYDSLISDLVAKYLCKARYIKRIKRNQNYDGTITITVTYDNDTRSVYTILDH